MHAVYNTLADLMPTISTLLVGLEIVAITVSIRWRRRALDALRVQDYDRGLLLLNEAPKIASLAFFVSIVPAFDLGLPALFRLVSGAAQPQVQGPSNQLSVWLLAIATAIVVGILAGMKFHRFMAGADALLRETSPEPARLATIGAPALGSDDHFTRPIA